MPKTLWSIGAGVIGLGYATILSALDAHVTLIEPSEAMLDFIDRELFGDLTNKLPDWGRLAVEPPLGTIAPISVPQAI